MTTPESSLKSVSLVSLLSFAHLGVQFALQVVLARYFGASAEMDAYYAALALPTVLSAILTGSLAYAFLPVFVARRERAGPEAAWSMAMNFLVLLVGVSAALALAGTIWASPIVRHLHPGFSATQVGRTALLFRVLSWLVLANSLVGYLQALHHSNQRFAVPAASGVVGTCVTLAYVVWRHEADGVVAVAWGVVIGSGVAIAGQLRLLLANRKYASWRLDPGTIRCLRLVAPLILGAAYYRLDPLVDRYLASRLPESSIAYLGYAWRLVNALLIVSTSSLSIVVFPSLAKHASLHDEQALRAEVAHAFRFLCFMLVPITLGLVGFSRIVVRDLFERGEFRPEDTTAVAMLLVIYLGALWGGGIGEIASKVFYAAGNTVLPVVIGVIGFTVGAGLKIALAPDRGVAGIAAATSAYYLLNSSALAAIVLARWGGETVRGVVRAISRYLLATVPAVGAAYAVTQTHRPLPSLVAAATAVPVYLLATLAQRDEFALKMYHFFVGQMQRLSVTWRPPAR